MIENGVITKKDITTGISSDEYVEVLDGIQEGDEVIRDLGSLEEGMQAEPVDASGDAGSVEYPCEQRSVFPYDAWHHHRYCICYCNRIDR